MMGADRNHAITFWGYRRYLRASRCKRLPRMRSQNLADYSNKKASKEIARLKRRILLAERYKKGSDSV